MTGRILSLAMLAAMAIGAPAGAVFQDGIDVSTHQNTINWTSVKGAGIKFAFTKATEGVDFLDDTFTANMAGAKAAGVLIGPYHFARPDSFNTNPNDAANEANDFVDAIQSYYQGNNLTLRPVLDVERLPGVGTTAQNKAFLSEWIRDFAAVVNTRLGFNPVIYANSDYAINYLETNINQFDFWLANYNYTPPTTPPVSQSGVFGSWDFWQYTGTGTVSGVSGNVDRDVFNGTMQQLSAFIPDFHAGDFDGNGIVDGRDYIRWRNTKNTTVNPGTGADADLSGIIDNADYTIWRANFGKTYSLAGSGAGSALGSSIVPEPASAGLVLVATIAGLAGARRRQRR
jgi:GH25 family lysozyme M1 (1,4-beta-N-acetylmuramidase)